MRLRRALGAGLAAALLAPSAFAIPPAMTKTEHRAYLDGPWGQIHVRIAGPPDGPVVLLIHKMVWSSVEFQKVQPLLAARGIRSVAVDLPGYGLSDGPAQQPSADDYADAMIAVLNGLHIGKAVVAGTDTGATIAAAFGVRYPDRAADLILEGLPIFEGKVLEEALAEPEFDRTARPDAETLTARWRMIDAMGKGGLSPELIQTGMLQFFGAGPHYLFGHQAIFRYDLAAALGRLTVPAMILTYQGDQLHAQALDAKRAHPGLTLVTIAASRMMADFQTPEPWATAVAARILAKDRAAR